MKKTLLLLSSLFVLLNTSPIYAQDNDLEKLQQEVQTKAQELNQAINDLRAAYNNNGAMKVGDPIVFDSGMIVTITNVEISDEEPSYPELGGELVRIDFTIDNQTSEELFVSGHDVEMYDGDRVKAEADSLNFWTETIAPGMKANGTVYRHANTLGNMTIVVGDGQWTVDL